MIHTIRSAVLFLSVLFVASQANAIALTMGGANGQDVNPGSQVSVTVALDTETTVGITLMSIGVLFDDTRLSYNQAASVTTSFILYDSLQKGGGNYMNASSTCGGGNGSPTAGFGCSLRLNTTNQVNIDYANRDLTNGTSSGPFSGNVGVAQLVTLVFDVLANPGFAAMTLSQTSPGNGISIAGGSIITGTLIGGPGVNVIPEPTTALLVGLGLAGLSVAGRRPSRDPLGI